MITPEDLPVVPIFASVPPEDLARLAQTSGDVRLGAGDYAVHEGDERSLFVVLAGRIEVTKVIDGIERVIGQRAPGQIFGEVPIIFGTPYQGSYRATESSRVMHLSARQFHALAAAHPEVLTKVAAIAAERIGGLKGIATAPPSARGLMLARPGDDSARAAAHLPRPQPDLARLDPVGRARCRDAVGRAAARRRPVAGPRLRRRLVAHARPPPRGRRARRPADATARRHLRRGDRRRRPGRARRGRLRRIRRTAHARHRARGARRPGGNVVADRELPGLSHRRLGRRAGAPRAAAGPPNGRGDHGHAHRRAIDPATRRPSRSTAATACSPVPSSWRPASSWRRLSSTGFDRLLGKGVYYGASRSEAGTTQGQDIHLIGAGNSAGQAAMFFANHARTVTLVVRGDSLEKSMSHYLVEQIRGKPNIQVALRSEVGAVHGEKQLEAIDWVDRTTGAVRRVASGGVFVFIGADAETGVAAREHRARRARLRLHGRGRGELGAMAAATATRICSRRPSRASSPAATCARVRSSASPRRSAKAAWRSRSCTSTSLMPAARRPVDKWNVAASGCRRRSRRVARRRGRGCAARPGGPGSARSRP